jgi:hypothetical protein
MYASTPASFSLVETTWMVVHPLLDPMIITSPGVTSFIAVREGMGKLSHFWGRLNFPTRGQLLFFHVVDQKSHEAFQFAKILVTIHLFGRQKFYCCQDLDSFVQ